MRGYLRQVAQSIDVALTTAEHRATQALFVIAKMILRINPYEQMLHHQRMIESIRDEVQEEFLKIKSSKAKADKFSSAEAAFLRVLKTKVDLLNTA